MSNITLINVVGIKYVAQFTNYWLIFSFLNALPKSKIFVVISAPLATQKYFGC
jgi:hypothetical protein